MLREVRRLDTVAEPHASAGGLPAAEDRLEQGCLPRPVRADERDVLAALQHERGVVEQLLLACLERQPVRLDHDPPRPGGLQELEAKRSARSRGQTR